MSRTGSKTDGGRGFNPADADLKARTTTVGSGAKPTGDLDRLIAETLEDLATGEPREGFRGRVMARIGASAEPAPIPGFEIFGWRVRSFPLAAAGVVAALGLIAALVIPSWFRQAGPKLTDTATALHVPAVRSQSTAVPAPPAASGQPVHTAESFAQFQSRRDAVQRVAAALPSRVADADPNAFPSVTVDPLSDPRPIVNHAIEIKPVEIQPLAIPEIQVPSLEAGGTGKVTDPGK